MTVELISSLAKFQSLKNEPFEIKLVDAILEAKLSDVVMRGKDPAGARDLYSLYFQTGPVGILPQGTYLLRHAKEGECLIFLVPVAGNADGATYEAVFN